LKAREDDQLAQGHRRWSRWNGGDRTPSKHRWGQTNVDVHTQSFCL